jgi:ATP-dependent Lhr-like helicase
MLYVERGGRTLLSWTDDPRLLAPAAAALAAAVRGGALGRLTVERADGARAGAGGGRLSSHSARPAPSGGLSRRPAVLNSHP